MKRRLSADEADLWRRVASTVTPITPPRSGEGDHEVVEGHKPHGAPLRRRAIPPVPLHQPAAGPPPRSGEVFKRPLDRHGLDASWDRKIARGLVSPDFTLDLHGASLDAAHARLDHGLTLALAQGARLVLLVTGKFRPSDDHAGRSERRGAIRAKFMDWLASGPHASRIAAVRNAHPRHGGAGAVYIVLRRAR